MATAARAARAQAPNRPRLLQAAVDAFQQPDIRRKLGHTVEHSDSPSVRGMITKVQHLLAVEEAKE